MPKDEGSETQIVRKTGLLGRLGWIAVAAILVGVGVFAWQRHGSPPTPRGGGRTAQIMSIVPANVQTGDIDVTLDALGTVTSLATVNVRPQISGQLTAVDFNEGQEVKKGDLLAEIDARPYEAALAQAKGQLARDQALLKGAQVDLSRYQGLAAQNAVPKQTLDTQVSLVAQYQGTVQTDLALVQAATVNLEYCRILAPLGGRTGLRQVDQGNYVTPGDVTSIVVITQIAPISVLFTVPEDQLPTISKRLQAGAALPVTARDRSGLSTLAEGELLTFDSQIDPTTGTIKLRALFANDNRSLFPNQFVNIELLVDQHKNVAIVPSAAIQRGVPGTFVYVVNPDSTVSVRKVELGVSQGERVEVVSGLSSGEQVVVDGVDRLRDGAKVTIRQANSPNPPPAATQPPRNRTRQPETGQTQ